MSGCSRALFTLAATLTWTLASAQTEPYPAKPIRMLSAQLGGGSDIAARLIAGGLSPRLGHQVVVDSRVGGTIIAETAVRATPDGYTIICSAFLTHVPRRNTVGRMRDGIAPSLAQFPYHRGSRLFRASPRASHVPRRNQWLLAH